MFPSSYLMAHTFLPCCITCQLLSVHTPSAGWSFPGWVKSICNKRWSPGMYDNVELGTSQKGVTKQLKLKKLTLRPARCFRQEKLGCIHFAAWRLFSIAKEWEIQGVLLRSGGLQVLTLV